MALIASVIKSELLNLTFPRSPQRGSILPAQIYVVSLQIRPCLTLRMSAESWLTFWLFKAVVQNLSVLSLSCVPELVCTNGPEILALFSTGQLKFLRVNGRCGGIEAHLKRIFKPCLHYVLWTILSNQFLLVASPSIPFAFLFQLIFTSF